MRQFLFGLVTGAALACGAFLIWGTPPQPGNVPAEAGRNREVVQGEGPASAMPESRPTLEALPVRDDAGSVAERSPSHDATSQEAALGLRIGQGLDLEAWRVVDGASPDADVRLADILPEGDQIRLLTRYGSHAPDQAQQPRFQVLDGADESGANAVPVVRPGAVLEGQDLWLRPGRSESGFVRSRGGSVFNVWLAKVVGGETAIDRVARLAAERADLSTGKGPGAPPETRLEALDSLPLPPEWLRDLRGRLEGIPRVSPTGGQALEGAVQEVIDPPRRARLVDSGGRTLLRTAFVGEWDLGSHTGLILLSGTVRGSELKVGAHSSVLIGGDHSGVLRLDHHSMAQLDGDLVGEVVVEDHAQLVVLGDLRGTLRLGRHGRAYVRGTLRGTLDLSRARHAHLLLGGRTYSKDDVEGLGRPEGFSTLYLQHATLTPGIHEGAQAFGGWMRIEVGGERWVALAR